MVEHTWEQRASLTRAGLVPLRFLLGSWEGTGGSPEAPLRGRLEIAARFGETWIEARETLWDAHGEIDHEDASFYRYDLVSEQVKVTQYSAPAWSQELLVVPTPAGCRWVGSPLGPRVELLADGPDGLIVEVWEPFQSAPGHRMVYRRA